MGISGQAYVERYLEVPAKTEVVASDSGAAGPFETLLQLEQGKNELEHAVTVLLSHDIGALPLIDSATVQNGDGETIELEPIFLSSRLHLSGSVTEGWLQDPTPMELEIITRTGTHFEIAFEKAQHE